LLGDANLNDVNIYKILIIFIIQNFVNINKAAFYIPIGNPPAFFILPDPVFAGRKQADFASYFY